MLINTRGVPRVVSRPQFAGLGVAPAVVIGTGAAAAAIGGLIALVQNSLQDDWADSDVFKANMRKIHSAMVAFQCVVGGAQAGSPLKDSFGNSLCEGGTKPSCALSAGQKAQWDSLRDGFSKFWSDVSSGYFGPSNADALQAKQFASDFYTFYQSLKATCAKQGTVLPDVAKPAAASNPSDWMKYGAWAIGGIAVIALAVSAKSIFGRG